LLLLLLLLFRFHLKCVSTSLLCTTGERTFSASVRPRGPLPVIIIAPLSLQLHVHNQAQLGTVLEDGLPPLWLFPHFILMLLTPAAYMESHRLLIVRVLNSQYALFACGGDALAGEDAETLTEPLAVRFGVIV